MKQKQHSTEEIIRILRQTDGDDTVESICREHNNFKATFHRWRRKYGDMDLADAMLIIPALVTQVRKLVGTTNDTGKN